MRKPLRPLLLIVLLMSPLACMAEMRCGKLGHSIIRFDSKYMFLPESYKGVSYWGGEGWRNRTKGCLDRLSSVTFTVDWPSLEASRNGTYFTRPLPDRIAFTYRPNTSKNPEWSWQRNLQRDLGDDVFQPLMDMGEIRKSAKFSAPLGLYRIVMPQRAPHHFMEGYWQEDEDLKITTIIVCTRYTSGTPSSCLQQYVDTKQDLWIQIDFNLLRLSDWMEMRRRAINFLEQFVVKEIEE